MEVDEQAKRFARKSQVAQHLRFVDGVYGLDRLDFKNDEIGDQEVQPVAAIKCVATVCDGQRNFASEWDAAMKHFVGEALLIRRLEQAGAKFTMNLNRCSDDLS